MPDGRDRAQPIRVQVELGEEEVSAVEGWRRANGFSSFEIAARELIRMGLMTELSRSFRVHDRISSIMMAETDDD
ncbi:MAG: hypothetical protein AAF334_03465 [Pseudomonadota bacterium]